MFDGSISDQTGKCLKNKITLDKANLLTVSQQYLFLFHTHTHTLYLSLFKNVAKNMIAYYLGIIDRAWKTKYISKKSQHENSKYDKVTLEINFDHNHRSKNMCLRKREREREINSW